MYVYCVYRWFHYAYIDINAHARGIESLLASHVWSPAVPMAVIRRNSTATLIKRMFSKPLIYVGTRNYAVHYKRV